MSPSYIIALLLIPALAASLLLLFAGSVHRRVARWIALGGTLAALGVACMLAQRYYVKAAEVRAEAPALSASPIDPPVKVEYRWLAFGSSLQLKFLLGLDGISVSLILLTALLTVSCVLISWHSIRQREAEFYIALLFLETGLLGVFCAFDLVLFYVFFEFTLIPLFFMIAIWGGP
jgi:NADH-quinone oxidoreductase subunit M